MTPRGRNLLVATGGIALIVLLCLLFPRVLAFVELAARELRYLWWLVLIAALGLYLVFFAGRKDR